MTGEIGEKSALIDALIVLKVMDWLKEEAKL
jgi:hypothetical protein